jgi:hypothetical protein
MSVEIGPPTEERPAAARQPRVSTTESPRISTTEQLDLERERSRERVRTLLTSSIVGVYLVSVLLVVVGAGLKIVDITLAKEINSNVSYSIAWDSGRRSRFLLWQQHPERH